MTCAAVKEGSTDKECQCKTGYEYKKYKYAKSRCAPRKSAMRCHNGPYTDFYICRRCHNGTFTKLYTCRRCRNGPYTQFYTCRRCHNGTYTQFYTCRRCHNGTYTQFYTCRRCHNGHYTQFYICRGGCGGGGGAVFLVRQQIRENYMQKRKITGY